MILTSIMNRTAVFSRTLSYLWSPLAACFLATVALAQTGAPPSIEVDYIHDTGVVQNPSGGPATIISFTVEVPGAEWVRLHFDQVRLGGDIARGTGSILRMTSWRDGAVQEMNAIHAKQWHDSSAYFNGDKVQVEVEAWAGTGPNRLQLRRVVAGTPPVNTESQCGSADDRVPLNDPRACRILNVGCTGWMINDCAHCFLTAGHCTSGIDIIEFNVPPSSSGGSINHPSPDDQYAMDGTTLQTDYTGIGNDWAYFGCFPNTNTGLTPYEAQGSSYILADPPPFDASHTIRITGYGVDSGTYNQYGQTHSGPYFSHSGTVVEYQVDTQGGNSGSAVQWDDAGVAIGIHTNGGCSSSSGNTGTGVNNAGLQAALANAQGLCSNPISNPGNVPTVLTPGVAIDWDVDVSGTVNGTSATLHVRYDGGAFLAIPSTDLGGGTFRNTLPPPVCGASPEFYFSIDHADCGVLTMPAGAPAATYTALVGSLNSLFSDDFETNQGWTVQDDASLTSGTWERGVPAGGGQRDDPAADSDGSGRCYLTENASGNTDVDGGPTQLFSPLFDLTGMDAIMSFDLWYRENNGDDFATGWLSADGGASWTQIMTWSNLSSWAQQSFVVGDLITPSAQVQFRLDMDDEPNNSVVEGGLDNFQIFAESCTANLSDCNENGILDSDDIASGRSADTNGDGVPDECGPGGDCNGNGIPDDQDIAAGTSSDCNGNALPDECELTVNSYCFCFFISPCGNNQWDTGCTNSTGSGSELTACGSSSVALDDLVLRADAIVAGQFGIFYMGDGVSFSPFGDGNRCVASAGAGLFRYPPTAADAAGIIPRGPGIVAFGLANFGSAGHIVPGVTWNFQAWYRDPGGPCSSNFNLSNGLAVTFSN